MRGQWGLSSPMKTENELLDSGRRLAALKDFGAQLLGAFSSTSAIELAIYDSQLRFRAVNNAAASKGASRSLLWQDKP